MEDLFRVYIPYMHAPPGRGKVEPLERAGSAEQYSKAQKTLVPVYPADLRGTGIAFS